MSNETKPHAFKPLPFNAEQCECGQTEHVGSHGWFRDTSFPPTSAELNALPPNLRRWVIALETDADPAGTLRKAALVEQENAQLRALVAELQGEA